MAVVLVSLGKLAKKAVAAFAEAGVTPSLSSLYDDPEVLDDVDRNFKEARKRLKLNPVSAKTKPGPALHHAFGMREGSLVHVYHT